MPLLYSSPLSDVVGKLLIGPRFITLYIQNENLMQNALLRGLMHYLTTAKNYFEIVANSPLHTDEVHCCLPNLREPSHAHFSFNETITPSILRRFFSDITEFQTNPEAVQASLAHIDGLEITPRSAANPIETLLIKLFGKTHYEFIKPSEARRIEQAYSLGVDEVTANMTRVVIYSFFLAILPNMVEHCVKKVFRGKDGVDTWTKTAKQVTKFAFLFYLMETDWHTRLMLAPMIIFLESHLLENQYVSAETTSLLSNTVAMMAVFFSATFSVTALNTAGALTASLLVGKCGVWISKRVFETPEAPAVVPHIRVE